MKRVNEQFSYIVDTGPLGKQSDIAPWVGFRCDAIERTLEELGNFEPDQYAATVSVNVGYALSGQYMSWVPPTTSSEVLQAISEALNRMEKYLSIEAITAAFSQIPAASASPMMHYRLATGQLLLKNVEGVATALSEGRKEYCKHDDEICARFTTFSDKVVERLKTLS